MIRKHFEIINGLCYINKTDRGTNIVDGNHYYSHSGSAGNYYANAIIIKEPGIVISIMANAGNGETKWGMLQIIKYLVRKNTLHSLI